MLLGMDIGNFKSFAATQGARLAPITLIYGPNSAGKSSLIQSLLMIKQTIESNSRRNYLLTNGSHAKLGNYKSLVHKHDLNNILRLNIGYTSDIGFLDEMLNRPKTKGHKIYISMEFMPDKNGSDHNAILRTVDYTIDYGDILSLSFTLDDHAYDICNGVNSKHADYFSYKFNDVESIDSLISFLRCAENTTGSYLYDDGNNSYEYDLYSEESFLEEDKDIDIVSYESLEEAEEEPDDERIWDDFRISQDCVGFLDDFSDIEDEKANDDYQHLKDYDINGNNIASADYIIDSAIADKKADSISNNYESLHIFKNSRISEWIFPNKMYNLDYSSYYGNIYMLPNKILDNISKSIVNTFNNISYLGPLREHPTRYYYTKGNDDSNVGTKGENIAEVLYKHKEAIESRLSNYFELFQIPYKLEIKKIGDELIGEIIVITLIDSRTNVAVTPADVGFGICQILPILVEGIISQQKIICVEQPEIHLHPRLQASLADYFIDTSKDNQWILETHSETLILRLLRRIKEKVISHKDVSVLYVSPNENGAKLMELRLDEHGDFMDQWPDGFFEDRYDDIFIGG
ncbi:DUF3696 domain-containing protein [Geobacter anodireducens]